MAKTGNNAATGGAKLKLKRQTLSKLIGGGFYRSYFKIDHKLGTNQFARMERYKNLVQINQLSNADHGAGCTDTGQLSVRIGCTATVDYC